MEIRELIYLRELWAKSVDGSGGASLRKKRLNGLNMG